MVEGLGRIGFGLFGLAVLIGITWLFSNNKRAVDWKLVATGITLQIAFAALVILAIGQDPWEALTVMVQGSVMNAYGWGYTLYYATSFMFTGLAVTQMVELTGPVALAEVEAELVRQLSIQLGLTPRWTDGLPPALSPESASS